MAPEQRIINNSIVSRDHHHDGTPCWEWIGKVVTNKTGRRYGRLNLRVKGKHVSVLAHRFSLIELRGRTLTKRGVCMHKCNNTLCVNPMHLAGGTQSKNIKQCVADGRHNSQRKKR